MHTIRLHGDEWQVLTTPVLHPASDSTSGEVIRHTRTGLYRMRLESGRLIPVPEEWAKRFQLAAVGQLETWTPAERVILADVAEAARERAQYLASTTSIGAALEAAQHQQIDADERGDVAGRCWWELIDLELRRIAHDRGTGEETAHIRAALS